MQGTLYGAGAGAHTMSAVAAIGAVWIGPAALSDRLARADALLLRINLLLLLFVTFMPFPTKLVAEAIRDRNSERVFVTLYGITLLAPVKIPIAIAHLSGTPTMAMNTMTVVPSAQHSRKMPRT